MNLLKQARLLAMASVIGVGIGLAGCSDSSSPNDQATVTMSAEMDQGGVGAIMAVKGGATKAGNEVDSIYVTRIRLLISNMKMHTSSNDTNTGDKTVKTGPFLIEYTPTGSKVFTNATVPAGSYDRIKFEIHKLTSSEVPNFLNDTIFRDFVTDDRWTVIIEGNVVDAGVTSPFTYRSKVTDNIQVRFEPDLVLEAGSTTNVALQFSPKAVFKKGSSSPLDPRDGANHSEMEKAIKNAIKAIKKG